VRNRRQGGTQAQQVQSLDFVPPIPAQTRPRAANRTPQRRTRRPHRPLTRTGPAPMPTNRRRHRRRRGIPRTGRGLLRRGRAGGTLRSPIRAQTGGRVEAWAAEQQREHTKPDPDPTPEIENRLPTRPPALHGRSRAPSAAWRPTRPRSPTPWSTTSTPTDCEHSSRRSPIDTDSGPPIGALHRGEEPQHRNPCCATAQLRTTSDEPNVFRRTSARFVDYACVYQYLGEQ
jgi:hypothetical protein